MKAKVNGIEMYYEVHGKEGAPWLTLSHSLACSVRMWDPQIEAFKGRYRILAYDARGHGESMAPAGPYTLQMMAEDQHALFKHLDIEHSHFAGLSMGGMIGQTFALEYRPKRRACGPSASSLPRPAACSRWCSRRSNAGSRSRFANRIPRSSSASAR